MEFIYIVSLSFFQPHKTAGWYERAIVLGSIWTLVTQGFRQYIRYIIFGRKQNADGLNAYLVEDSFYGEIDYAQLVKMYCKSLEGEHRYSPAEVTGIKKKRIVGKPNHKHISTSFVERQNLTMRTRKFTRLTNGFLKKIENHYHA